MITSSERFFSENSSEITLWCGSWLTQQYGEKCTFFYSIFYKINYHFFSRVLMDVVHQSVVWREGNVQHQTNVMYLQNIISTTQHKWWNSQSFSIPRNLLGLLLHRMHWLLRKKWWVLLPNLVTLCLYLVTLCLCLVMFYICLWNCVVAHTTTIKISFSIPI